MGLFNKLFKSHVNHSTDDKVKEKVKIKRTIFDFFDFDLCEIPNELYIEGPVETNVEGIEVRNFRIKIDQKLFGIFDNIEIKITSNSKNVFFKTFDAELVKIELVRKLINDLYLIYGPDDRNKRGFNSADIKDFNSKDFHALFGRSWMDCTRFQYPVSIYRDGNVLSFGIWGVPLGVEKD